MRLTVLLVVTLAACTAAKDPGSTDTATEGETDTATDSGDASDADSAADTESETDTGTETDTDTGRDTGTDTDTDTDTDPCTAVWFRDADDDGYGTSTDAVTACEAPAGYVGNDDDCDDADPSVWSEGTWYDDIDGDGHGSAATASTACHPGAGQVSLGDDCNDVNGYVSPSQPEVCNDVEDDCDGLTDDDDPDVDLSTGTEWALDNDGDGHYGAEHTVWACDRPAGVGTLASADDCDDDDRDVNPDETEVCNDGVDQDCDGAATACGIASGTSATADGAYAGEDASEYVGVTVVVSDLDGDGTGDVSTGATRADQSGTETGAVYSFGTWTGGVVTTADAAATFYPGASATYASTYFGAALATGDLNRDGDADLLGGSAYYSTELGVAVGFTPGSSWSTAAYVTVTGAATDDLCGYAVAVGDLSGDGNPDGIVSCVGESGGSVYLYDRTSLLSEISRTDTRNPYSYGTTLDVADLDGDGQEDLLVGADEGSYLFLNLGPITTSSAYSAIYDESRNVPGAGEASSAVGDVDHDGYPDVYISGSTEGESFLLRGGTGSILAAAAELGVRAGDGVGGDFDNDGVQDLAIGNPAGAGEVEIAYGPIGSTFSADIRLTGRANEQLGYSLSAGDVNGDGVDDLLVGAPYCDYAASDGGMVYAFLGGGL